MLTCQEVHALACYLCKQLPLKQVMFYRIMKYLFQKSLESLLSNYPKVSAEKA